MGDLIFRRDRTRTGEAETRPRGTHMRMGNRNHRKTVRAHEREAGWTTGRSRDGGHYGPSPGDVDGALFGYQNFSPTAVPNAFQS